ncbi:MAG: 50S ribosomal protein L9 [Desulfobacteraceae bacterium 4572_130]|nr:MAG: 50S ribosomal protein L9 [Desulfobacteraceae bacterium 4572_130]
MKIILKETIDTLGIVGSECNVASGYARNYLFPQGKAIKATPQNRKIIEQAKAKFEIQIIKEKKIAEEMAERLKDVKCTIQAKAYDENKLYGSIKTHDIKTALNKQNIKIERRAILLSEPIKEIGDYKVGIRLYKDVEPEITVIVVPEKKNEE